MGSLDVLIQLVEPEGSVCEFSSDVYGSLPQVHTIRARANLLLVFVSALYVQMWSDRRRVWPEICGFGL